LVIVPAAAIQRGPQGTYVYVVHNNNTAKIQTVTLAQTTANLVGLSAGLNPGDVVVVDGQDKLQDGSKVVTTMAPAVPPNPQNANVTRPPTPSQPANPLQSGARRRTEPPQQSHPAGKSQ
jgi:multidrug efflux system membrane fusion protein